MVNATRASTKAFLVTVLFLIIALIFISNLLSSKVVKPQTPSYVQPLSKDEYSRIETELVSLVKSKDPTSSIERLKQEMNSDPAVLRSCHELIHQIGRAAYDKYQDFAKTLTFQDVICTSGYIHGVMEAYFADTGDVFKVLQTVCNQYPKGSFFSWECFHGVGHGLMYFSSNDLPKSLDRCKSYQDRFEVGACMNGVFMENFNTEQKLHPSNFLNPDDPVYPCRQISDYKEHCYMNAPIYLLSLNNYNFADALKKCDSVEAAYQYSCYLGIGAQAARRNLNNFRALESICELGGQARLGACIDGVVSMQLSHYGSLKNASNLCSQFSQKNIKVCQRAVNNFSKNYLFN